MKRTMPAPLPRKMIRFFLCVLLFLSLGASALAEQILVCTIPEHTHQFSCYNENNECVCGQEAHTHGEDCYKPLLNWYAKAELHWHTPEGPANHLEDTTISKDHIQLVYDLTISTQGVDYKAGDLEVRLPYALWKTRLNYACVPAEITVPQKPQVNVQYSFHYYIDTKGTSDQSDDEIVFVNAVDVKAGLNQTLSVRYDIDPSQTIDCSSVELTGKLTGRPDPDVGLQESITDTITYRLDTGIDIKKTSKTYQKNIYYWDDTYGEKPADFDPEKFNYVAYTFGVCGEANQPYYLEFVDHAGENGQLVSALVTSDFYYYGGTFEPNYENNSFKVGPIVLKRGMDRDTHRESYVNFVVAYPRTGADEGTVYHNSMTVKGIAADAHPGNQAENDQNDLDEMDAQTESTWEDYHFVYDGEIYRHRKAWGGTSASALGYLRVGEDYMLESVRVVAEVNGYNLGNYSVELFDSDIYWAPLSSYSYNFNYSATYTPLDENDYEIATINYTNGNYVSVTFTGTDVDRTNGQTVQLEMPESPFVLWAQKGKNSEWLRIAELTEKNSKVFSELIDGKGYTGLKVTSPKGLTGKWEIAFSFRVKLLSTSPVAHALMEAYNGGPIPGYVQLLNFSGMKLYQENEQGEYVWINPQTQEITSAEKVGLAQLDQEREGARINRADAVALISDFKYIGGMKKYVDAGTNDTVNNKMDYRFTLAAYNGVRRPAPDVARESVNIPTGVFYDLLPEGFVFNENAGVEVTGPRFWSSSSRTLRAVVTKTETIDNYKGTGRQMVIFHVKSLEKDLRNYSDGTGFVPLYGQSLNTSDYCSGFILSFTGSISWTESAYYQSTGPNSHNMAAFQAGDNRELPEGSKDEGTRISLFAEVVDSDGNPAFRDVNGDGETSQNDTYYSYVHVPVKALTTIETGVSKSVRPVGGTFGRHASVALGGNYEYLISFSTSDNGITENLIIYDILEEADNTEESETLEQAWKGVFQSVDVSQLERVGISPVVYYATASGLNYENLSLDTPNVWKNLNTDPPADPAAVTALAFDLRTGSNQQPFQMLNHQTLALTITMKAPEAMPAAELAYNRPSYSCQFTQQGSDIAQAQHNVAKRVTVELTEYQDFSFIKLGETEETPEPLEGVPFTLYQCLENEEGHTHHGQPGESSSCWGKTPIRKTTSDVNGRVTFSYLGSGEYAFTEGGVLAYEYNSAWYEFTVDAKNGSVSAPVMKNRYGRTYPEFTKNQEDEWTLVNPRTKTTVYATKRFKDSLPAIQPSFEEIEVILYRDGEEIARKHLDARGECAFKDLFSTDRWGKAYTYTVAEVPVDGYESVITVSPYNYSSYIITNTMLGVLELSKQVVGGSLERDFDFTVALTADDGVTPVTGTFTALRYSASGEKTKETLTFDESGTCSGVQLRHGQRLQIIGLPLNARYRVQEESAPGYTSAVTAGESSGILQAAAINAVSFTNTYHATGSLTLTAYKTVNGQTPTADQVFSFHLENGANTPAVSQTKQNAGGTITFDPLNYTLADAGKTYTYTLVEISQDENGFFTDKSFYNIDVRIDDNGDGTLNSRVTAYNGEIYVTQILFENLYMAEGSLTLTAEKTVNGKTPTDDQRYTFLLESGENTPALRQTKENVGGTVTFDPLLYTLEDAGKTYTYTVKETSPDAHGLTADKTVYTVTVTIADNKDGTLRVTPAYSIGEAPAEKMAFHNTLVGSIVLSKRVEGSAASTDEEFAFTVTLSDESGTPLTDAFAYAGSREGTLRSGDTLMLKDGEAVTISGVPVGTMCVIAESNSVRHTTTVNGADASGLRFSVTGENMPAAFVNTLITKDFTVTKEWQGGNEGAISLTLYGNGEKLDPQPACTRNGDTYTYTGLPKYDSQGQEIVYAAKERYVGGYMTIYKNVAPYEDESSFIYDGGTIVNRAITEIAVRKVWTGMGENEEKPEITLTLYCNGQVVDKKPKLDKNGWYHFYNLPIRESPYYVVETPVDGYATSYENTGDYADATDRAYNGGTITNHKIPKTGDNSHVEGYLALLLLSLAGLVLCRRKAAGSRR